MNKTEKAEESRNKILKAAIEEFGEKGYKLASTNVICEKLGVSKGIIFYHFGSKEQLFKEVVQFCISDFDDYMRENFVKGNTPMEGIRGCCLLRKKYFLMHPKYLHIFEDVLYGSGKLSEATARFRESYEKHSFDIIDKVLEGTELNSKIQREESVWMAVRLIELIDMQMAFRYQEKAEKKEVSQEILLEEQMQYYEGYLEALLYGLLKR